MPSWRAAWAMLPPQASTVAPEIDRVFYYIYWCSAVFFVIIVASMFYFMWKYRAAKNAGILDPASMTVSPPWRLDRISSRW